MPSKREAGTALTDEEFAACEAVLGYQFQNRELLRTCLTHASGANHRLNSNERLEFLGDSIMGSAVCEMLYHRFPEEPEGELTRIKSIVVSRAICAKVTEEMRLHEFLLLGKGLGGHEMPPMSVMAAVFESIVAGVHLDGGHDAVRAFLERVLLPEIELAAGLEHGHNYKSQLQQVSQRTMGATPVYRLLDETGPDHAKCFKVTVFINDKSYPPAWGANKKSAEQRAAHNALNEIEGKPIPYLSETSE
ncbi:MAG: ribonuclease III [Planctomycetales bacterium]|nr:ribonuclease III [Planctomycetales bacterium]